MELVRSGVIDEDEIEKFCEAGGSIHLQWWKLMHKYEKAGTVTQGLHLWCLGFL